MIPCPPQLREMIDYPLLKGKPAGPARSKCARKWSRRSGPRYRAIVEGVAWMMRMDEAGGIGNRV